MDTQNFDISSYASKDKLDEKDIIDLAHALVRVNRMHEIGEVAFSSDELFEPGQLSIIKQALLSISESKDNENDPTAFIALYRKLHQLKG